MSEQTDQLNAVVKKYSTWAGAAGLLPSPLLDFAATAAIQLKMVNELADICEVERADHRGKTAIGSLVGGSLPASLGSGTIKNLVGFIPVVGNLAKIGIMPAFTAASTYAVGQVFMQHFASGGTFLNFDPDAVRDHYEEQYKVKLAAASSEAASDSGAEKEAAA